MKVLHPLRLTAYSNTKLTLCALCGDQERSFEFKFEHGPVPVLNGNSSFLKLAVLNAGIGSWITRAASALLGEYETKNKIEPEQYNKNQTISLKVQDSSNPDSTLYQVDFNNSKTQPRLFEIRRYDEIYLLSESGKEWHGKFDNMRLTIKSTASDEDRMLIKSIFCMQRARQENDSSWQQGRTKY